MGVRKDTTGVDRRTALAAAGAAVLTLGVARGTAAQAVRLTAQERANIKIVDDFIAAWNARNGAKVMSFFSDDARFSVGAIGNTRPWSKPDFADFIKNTTRLTMTVTPGTTWARGPVVTHERRDEIEGLTVNPSGLFIAVFTLRDNKIVDFLDFNIARPAR